MVPVCLVLVLRRRHRPCDPWCGHRENLTVSGQRGRAETPEVAGRAASSGPAPPGLARPGRGGDPPDPPAAPTRGGGPPDPPAGPTPGGDPPDPPAVPTTARPAARTSR